MEYDFIDSIVGHIASDNLRENLINSYEFMVAKGIKRGDAQHMLICLYHAIKNDCLPQS